MMQFDKLNREVKRWSSESASMMKNKVSSLTNNSKHIYLRTSLKSKTSYGYAYTLADSIRSKVQLNFGVAERITFPFNKYGFYIAAGASRGHRAKSNPRAKIEWYKFVFETRFENLADIVAENYADAVIKSMAREL
jgi:hypothetical protein